MVLDEVCEGKMRFDCRGMRVVELFSFNSRRFRGYYCAQLKKVMFTLVVVVVVVAAVVVCRRGFGYNFVCWSNLPPQPVTFT